jgi:hypothetical protein
VSRFTLPFATVCFVGMLLFVIPARSHAKPVVVGDAIVDDELNHFVIYYKSTPGVGNPGRRKHEFFSYEEVADELRRAKNNGWEIDFRPGRSYMESRIVLAGEEDNPASFSKRPIKSRIMGTTWNGKIKRTDGITNPAEVTFGESGVLFEFSGNEGVISKSEGTWSGPVGDKIEYRADDAEGTLTIDGDVMTGTLQNKAAKLTGSWRLTRSR